MSGTALKIGHRPWYAAQEPEVRYPPTNTLDGPGRALGVVTGDNMRGMEMLHDNAIIFADSGDSHDDRKDGVTSFNVGVFDALWFDTHYFPQNMKDRAWVVAIPGNAAL